MWNTLRRHPVPIRTSFGHSLVLTYAFPAPLLASMLPPGLALDAYATVGREYGFVAVGIVSARSLRPAPLPAALGGDYLLTGYRIFATFPTPGGRTMRGLWIMRSDTDRRRMVLGGNLLTRYHYRRAAMGLTVTGSRLEATVDSCDGRADLRVTADLASAPAPLPPSSVFATAADARRFAGPLPYTFDYEVGTDSMIVVKAHRSQWHPEPVSVEVDRLTFFSHGAFAGSEPRLAAAFHVADLEYGWHRGSRRALDGALR